MVARGSGTRSITQTSSKQSGGGLRSTSVPAALLRQITPSGDRAARTLVELITLKDTAQYGLIPIGS
ncbi:MAG TPA: hypothetical protein VF129_09490 [Actinomycetota bacterium]